MTEIPIIYQDEHLIAVNKPPGTLSQSDAGGNDSLIEYLETVFKQKLHILNRLDRPVSGCVLLARTPPVARKVSEQISKRIIEKTYLALVENAPEKSDGTIRSYLRKQGNKAYAANEKTGQLAITHYKQIAKSEHYFLMMLRSETGRFHQLRAHMSFMGCPIKGDVKYGARRSNKDRSIDLHAFRLVFDHPLTAERLMITALPKKEPVWDALRAWWEHL